MRLVIGEIGWWPGVQTTLRPTTHQSMHRPGIPAFVSSPILFIQIYIQTEKRELNSTHRQRGCSFTAFLSLLRLLSFDGAFQAGIALRCEEIKVRSEFSFFTSDLDHHSSLLITELVWLHFPFPFFVSLMLICVQFRVYRSCLSLDYGFFPIFQCVTSIEMLYFYFFL